MTATYDRTSFGERRRQCFLTDLVKVRTSIDERLSHVTDHDQRERLAALRDATCAVIADLEALNLQMRCTTAVVRRKP